MKGRPKPFISLALQVTGTKAAAVDVEAHPDPVAHHSHEENQQTGHQSETSPHIEEKSCGRKDLQNGKRHGHRHYEHVRDQAESVNDRGKGTRIQELVHTGVEEQNNINDPHDPVYPV
jgi:hypothetical protein